MSVKGCFTNNIIVTDVRYCSECEFSKETCKNWLARHVRGYVRKIYDEEGEE